MQPTLPFPRDGSVPMRRFRRRVHRLVLDPLPDGSYIFKTKSFTRETGTSYRCRINPHTGYVWCSCRDFKYRRDRWKPNYWDGPVCKHLKRAIRTVRRLQKKEPEMFPPAKAQVA